MTCRDRLQPWQPWPSSLRHGSSKRSRNPATQPSAPQVVTEWAGERLRLEQARRQARRRAWPGAGAVLPRGAAESYSASFSGQCASSSEPPPAAATRRRRTYGGPQPACQVARHAAHQTVVEHQLHLVLTLLRRVPAREPATRMPVQKGLNSRH